MPDPDDRLHTLGSGEPGAQWNTGGLGVGGQIAYDANTGLLSMTGVVDVLNYYNPNDPACPTNVGSNCAFNFGPDLDITFQALFHSMVVTPLGGSLIAIQTNYETTGGVDLIVTDPTDGNSVVFQASLQAGLFQGNPTLGLTSTVVFDTATNTAVNAPPVNASAFLAADTSTLFASLFEPTFFGINFASIADFDDGAGGGLDEILAASVVAGTLQSYTAEGNGQVFNLEAGQFVPEPGTATLLLGAAVMAAVMRRRLHA